MSIEYTFYKVFLFFYIYKSKENVNKNVQLMTIITLLSNIICDVSFCYSFAIKI